MLQKYIASACLSPTVQTRGGALYSKYPTDILSLLKRVRLTTANSAHWLPLPTAHQIALGLQCFPDA